MSRYLTPSKIGLLALISLYSDSVVPSAAAVPVLSFLISHILPAELSLSKNDSATSPRSSVLSIDAFQKATITHASGIPGRTVWDLLLKKLWEINSVDALHVFFDNLSSLLEKPRAQLIGEDGKQVDPKRITLSRGSPLGAFIRRAQLEFTRLQFHDGVMLWKSFVTYRGPTLSLWKRRNPTAGRLSFDSNLEDLHNFDNRLLKLVYSDVMSETCKEASVSIDDMEKLLEYQVDQLQSMCESCIGLRKMSSDLNNRNGEQASTFHEHSISEYDQVRCLDSIFISLCKVRGQGGAVLSGQLMVNLF